MTKKNFVSLAAHIRKYQDFCKTNKDQTPFNNFQIQVLADFCEEQNPAFDRDRWARAVKSDWEATYRPRRRDSDGIFIRKY